MAIKLDLKTKTKLSVKRDLFNDDSPKCDKKRSSEQLNSSPLKSIWSESVSLPQTSPNSILLSPDLKRSPNRFSTFPKIRKDSSTPKKKTTPRKLSKYSPFRKSKAYNIVPNNSIKQFFPVKESKFTPYENNSLGIQTLPNPSFQNCTGNNGGKVEHQSQQRSLTNNGANTSNGFNSAEGELFEANMKSAGALPIGATTPNKTNKNLMKTPCIGTPQSTSKVINQLSPSPRRKDIYSSFLSRVALDAMLADLDPNSVGLLNEEELSHISSFSKFDQPSQRLYSRLLNRKIDWIRTASLKYGDITLELILLEQQHFITTDCSGESIETLLTLLKLPELKTLCKVYKMPDKGLKSEIISKIISKGKQPSITSFFSNASGASTNNNNLRDKIIEQLSCVIKVTERPLLTFSRCLLLFSYPHFKGLERDRFSDQLALHGQLQQLKFPSYEICRTNIFQSREQFLMYQEALLESSALLESKEDRQWEKALIKLRCIRDKLEEYLNHDLRRFVTEAFPDFLRKFTAGGCYVRAISSAVDMMRSKDAKLIEQCLELLLSQRLFECHRRGQWYEQLACLHQNNCKDNVKATETVLRGLRDQYIDLVSRHMLCARAAMLEGRKKNGLKEHLKDSLATQRRLVEQLQEPESITISEQALERNVPGYKRVYVQDSEDGKMLSSVEEVVIQHYRQQGYTHGGHDEGGTVRSLVLACFWDEIYGVSFSDLHGLFHSEFQTVPLDWNSGSFYETRRNIIKSKLQDLAEGGMEAVLQAYQKCYVDHFGEESLINWKCLNNCEHGQSLAKCIDLDLFLNLSRLLLKHHRVYRSGFPDLTLWNPDNGTCIFVEVKSVNDHLSMKQRLWLHSLNKMGATALVCHVQSVGCKSQKRSHSLMPQDV